MNWSSSLRFQSALVAALVGAAVLILRSGIIGGVALPDAPRVAEAAQSIAIPEPNVTDRPASLEDALNSDGSIRPVHGGPASFDARGWRLSTAADGSPRFLRQAEGDASSPSVSDAPLADPDDALWDDRFGTKPGAENVSAVAVSGTEIFVGGSFDYIAGVKVNRVARWTGTRWTGLFSGTLEGVTSDDGHAAHVFALAMSGTDLLIGGRFGFAGGITAFHVARWDGVRFSPLLSGTANGITDRGTSSVNSMVITGGKVYVGGYFKAAGGLTTSRIAAWDGQRWSALASGGQEGVDNGGSLVPTVLALGARGAHIYAGGIFTRAGATPANNIARWDGVSWTALMSGTANGVTGGERSVRAIDFRGSEVVAGGGFIVAGGSAANSIARWDGIRWLPVLSGTANGLTGFSRPVLGLAIVGTDIIAAGEFVTAGGRVATNIARWNGASWSQLTGGGGEGLNDRVQGLARSGDGVVAVGVFWRAGGVAASGIARWTPSVAVGPPGGGGVIKGAEGAAEASQVFATWSRFSPDPINGPDGPVNAVALSGTDVIVGGHFAFAGTIPAAHIARWNGVTWSPLLSGTANGVNGPVQALAMSGTTVYATGRFTEAGGAPANRVAAWDGVRWSPLLSGTKNGIDEVGFPQPFALAAAPDGIYLGGSFTMAGGAEITGLARWTGSAWTGLLSGTRGLDDGYVRALAVSGTQVFAAGFMPVAGGITVNHVARWDGVRWSALMSGSLAGLSAFADPRAIAISGTDVFVGGEFSFAGGERVDRVARWDGQRWHRLGHEGSSRFGVSGSSVNALAVSGGKLFVGGEIFEAGALPVRHVASWDGKRWKPLGSGTEGDFPYVSALAASSTDLFVGGSFDLAGAKPAWNFSRWAIAPGGIPSGIGTTVLVPAVVKGYTGGW